LRVLLSTYGSRGDVESLVGLAVQLRRALGAQLRVCAPPAEDFAELLARGGVPPLLDAVSGERLPARERQNLDSRSRASDRS
jgi:vancomycin aglycone glucosyltransferase